MKIKINNLTMPLTENDYSFTSILLQELNLLQLIVKETQQIKEVEDFYNFFSPEEILTINILNDENEIESTYEEYKIKNINKIENKEDNSFSFFLIFEGKTPEEKISKSLANIDYLAMMLDIDLEEEV